VTPTRSLWLVAIIASLVGCDTPRLMLPTVGTTTAAELPLNLLWEVELSTRSSCGLIFGAVLDRTVRSAWLWFVCQLTVAKQRSISIHLFNRGRC
jgi:hypothetical protein